MKIHFQCLKLAVNALIHAEILPQDDRLRWTSLGSASLQSNFMADALMGSLPRGLSLNEREKIFASTPLSSSLSLLSSMPSVSVLFCKIC